MPLAMFSRFQDGSPPRNKSSAILVFGEHAREVITPEVGLWLSRVLVGDTAELFGWEEWRNAFKPLGVAPDQIQATVQGWVNHILDNLVVKLLPVENVDGRQAWEAGNLCLRKTSKGVDLNRQYPFAFATEPPHSEMYGGPHPFSEAQSRMIARMALEDGTVPKAYINVHSGEWAVYSGWDSKAAIGPGQPGDLSDVLIKSGEICSCQAGPAGAVSNYLAFGTGMDFMYTQLGVPYALTYEVYGMAQLGTAGKMPEGEKNRPLTAYSYETDDRIARTVPRIDDLLPAPTGRLQHLRERQRSRRAAWEAAGAVGAVEGAARATHPDGTAAGGVEAVGGRDGVRRRHRRRRWRQRATGMRRMFGGPEDVSEQDLGASAAAGAEEEEVVQDGSGQLAVASGVGLGGRMLRAAGGAAGDSGSALVHAATAADGGAARRKDEGALEEAAGAAGGAVLRLGGRSMRRLAAAAAAAVDGVGLADGALAEAEASVFDSLAGSSTGALADAAEAASTAEGMAAGSLDSRGPARELQAADISSFGGPDGPIIAMVRSKLQMYQGCFDMFNPPPGTVYRDVISRWVVILLWTLDHVADPANPKPSPHALPGTVLAGAGASAAGGHRSRQLLQVGGRDDEAGLPGSGGRDTAAGATAGARSEATSGFASEPRVLRTADAGGGQYGSAAFDQRVRERVYEVDPVMRQHSLVVLVALCCLGAVFVPWWMVMMKRPGGRGPQQGQGGGGASRRPRVPSRAYI